MGGGFVGKTGAGRLGAAASRIGAAALFMRRGYYYDNGTLKTKACRLDVTRQMCYQ